MTDDAGNTPLHPDSPLDGRYVLQQRLGGGGMADVYLAEDLTLRRSVAVKILKAELAADPDLVERFRIEAQAAAQLNHPNIVAVFDRGATGASAYIVMEYVRGETLKQRVRRTGPLAPEQAVRTALAVLAALEAAHGRRIVHRDVTSANVLIDDGQGQGRGFRHRAARWLDAHEDRNNAWNVGVPFSRAGSRSPGGRALGSLQPRRRALRDAHGPTAVHGRQRRRGRRPARVVRPPDPRSLVPDLPAALVAVVAKALNKEPGHRYQSAAEFAAALRSSRVPEPGFAPPPVPPPLAVTAVAAEAPTQADAGPTRQMRADERPTPPRRRRASRRWIALLFVAIGVAVAVWAVATFVLGAGVKVPALAGRTQEDAVAALVRVGLKPVVHEVWADGVEAGDVVRQRPTAGTEVDDGVKVDVWVSRGPLHISAPDLAGQSAKTAAAILEEQVLTGRRRKAASESAPEGEVFRQRPAAGVVVARGDTVTFWVSTGPPLIAVPDVVGLLSTDAISVLDDKGFVVNVDLVVGWGASPGDVVAQDPVAGTRLRPGDEVVIDVAIF